MESREIRFCIGILVAFCFMSCKSISMIDGESYRTTITSMKAANLDEQYFFNLLGTKRDETLLIYGLVIYKGDSVEVLDLKMTSEYFSPNSKTRNLNFKNEFVYKADQIPYMYLVLVEMDQGIDASDLFDKFQINLLMYGETLNSIPYEARGFKDQHDFLGASLIPIKSSFFSKKRIVFKGKSIGRYRYVIKYKIERVVVDSSSN